MNNDRTDIWKTFRVMVLLAVGIGLFSGELWAGDGGRIGQSPGGQANYLPGEMLVKFRPSVPRSAQALVIDSLGHENLGTLGGLDSLYVVRFDPGNSVEEAVEAYRADPNVEYAQPNYIYKLMQAPDDTDYDLLWGLSSIDSEAVWDHITDCGSVVVAVLDTGVNYTHEDLAGNMWAGGPGIPNHGWDFVDNDNDPMPADGLSHGTHVAGTIGAVGNNGKGTTGVCWDVQIMALRAGTVTGFTTSSILQGIDFALENGVKIINMSFGGYASGDLEDEAIGRAQQMGVLVVAAAGNESNDNDVAPLYPCSFDHDNILCVAALDRSDALAEFSNYGGTTVDVGAPGVNILSPVAGPTFGDDFKTGWTSTGDWAHSLCELNIGPFDMLVNPSDWCAEGHYVDDADHRVYKEFDLSVFVGASVKYNALFETELQWDFFRVAYEDGGGDPFVSGTLLAELSGFGLYSGSNDLSGCLTESCSLGYQLQSDSTINYSGIGISDFKLSTAQLDSKHYGVLQGTSMASPHVAGLSAMIWAYNPDYTYRDVVASVKEGGVFKPALERVTTTGKAVNAMGALYHLGAPTGITVNLE